MPPNFYCTVAQHDLINLPVTAAERDLIVKLRRRNSAHEAYMAAKSEADAAYEHSEELRDQWMALKQECEIDAINVE